MVITLESLENVSVDRRTGSVWDLLEMRYGFLEIFKVLITLLKSLWKFSHFQCDSLLRFDFTLHKK